jgi:hypothetical protein
MAWEYAGADSNYGEAKDKSSCSAGLEAKFVDELVQRTRLG